MAVDGDVLGTWQFHSTGSAGGDVTPIITEKGGMLMVSSADSALGVCCGLTGAPTFIKPGEKWNIAARFGVTNRGDVTTNDTRLTFGAIIPNGFAGGVLGARVECGYVNAGAVGSSTHWCAVFYDGVGSQTLVSTVVLSSTLRDFEFGYDGTNVYLIVDRGTPVTAAPTNLPLSPLILGIFHARAIDDDGPADCGIDKILCTTGVPTTYSAP